MNRTVRNIQFQHGCDVVKVVYQLDAEDTPTTFYLVDATSEHFKSLEELLKIASVFASEEFGDGHTLSIKLITEDAVVISDTKDEQAAAPTDTPRYAVIAKANAMRQDHLSFTSEALRRMAKDAPGYWFDEESGELRAGIGAAIYVLSGDS